MWPLDKIQPYIICFIISRAFEFAWLMISINPCCYSDSHDYLTNKTESAATLGHLRTPMFKGHRQTCLPVLGRFTTLLCLTCSSFEGPLLFHLNIEGLPLNKISVLRHLSAQLEALLILLEETHYTSAEKLIPELSTS